MSEEIVSLKRLDVANHLNELKVSPKNPDYKTKYVNYICEHYGIQESEIPSKIYTDDIRLIKNYYNKANNTFKHMLKKHETFFDASAIEIKSPSNSVCF